MKLRQRKYLLAVGALLLPLLVLWSAGGFRSNPAPIALGVGLIGVENNPIHHVKWPTVLNGITGLSAIFAITNMSQDASIWFDTRAVERRVGGEWRGTPVPPYPVRVSDQQRLGKQPWFAIASDEAGKAYPPGTCWYYVVAWPPDVPTNATWRLRLRYGRQPSAAARRLDAALRVDLFAKRRKGESLLTPEVSQ